MKVGGKEKETVVANIRRKENENNKKKEREKGKRTKQKGKSGDSKHIFLYIIKMQKSPPPPPPSVPIHSLHFSYSNGIATLHLPTYITHAATDLAINMAGATGIQQNSNALRPNTLRVRRYMADRLSHKTGESVKRQRSSTPNRVC